MTEKAKIDYLTEVFSKDNCLIILEFVSEICFNKNILHNIKVLLNETKNNVIITTSYYSVLKEMTFAYIVKDIIRMLLSSILDSVEYYVEIVSTKIDN